MKKKVNKSILLALLLTATGALTASNVRITSTPQVAYGAAAVGLPTGYGDSLAAIKFDIAWDNSWKTASPVNNDALWLFVKYYDGTEWAHAYLHPDTTGTYNVPGKITGTTPDYSVDYYVEEKTGATNGLMVFEQGLGMAQVHNGKIGYETETPSLVNIGMFLKRKNLGEGHVKIPGVILTWNYKRQGMTQDMDIVVKVFAVEMVLVGSGSFRIGFLGNPALQPGGFVTSTGTTPFYGGPYLVDSEDEIPTGTAAGSLWTYAGQQPVVPAGFIPDTFPKGYKAFYIMKYELTQQAFGEMMNTISLAAAGNLSPFDFVSEASTPNSRAYGSIIRSIYPQERGDNYWAWMYRCVLAWKKSTSGGLEFGCDANGNGVFNETDTFTDETRGELMTYSIDGQDLPMHPCNPYMLAAYAGFAGLRPMTELEYEKACRGPKAPASDEFAWGSSNFVATAALMIWGYNGTAEGSQVVISHSPGLFQYLNTGREKVQNPASNVAAGKSVHQYTWWNRNTWWGGSNGWWLGFGSTWWHGRKAAHQGNLVRVGALADSTTNRTTSGASYWGAMNLSDNAYELCVQASPNGLNYNGEHGNGNLTTGVINNVNYTYPMGANIWRMPTNTAMWISRGIRYRSYVDASLPWEDNVSNYSAYLSVNREGSPFMPANTGRVGDRANQGLAGYQSYITGGGSNPHVANGFYYNINQMTGWGYNSANAGMHHAGIRCVRTVGATK